jgi:flagellar protein FlaF
MQSPLNAYQSVEKATLTGRELEASVLSRAAIMLVECQKRWDESGHEDRLDAAVRFNQKVWSFFQAELTMPEHPLPNEIKVNLLQLSAFVDRRLFEVIAKPEAARLNAIININLNLAAGLRGDPGKL